jgi:DNA repair protein RecO (recombination protein O)
MNWEDESYLLSKRKFRENATIVTIFSSKKGKIAGIVYGGNSRKVKNYLQIGNKLFVVYNSKSENKIGYFKTELIKAVSPIYFNDKDRSSAISSLCNILNILLPDSQINEKIYQSFEKIINSLNNDNWIILYILFEIKLIKDLGYDTNLTTFQNNCDEGIDFKMINIDGYRYEVPTYLIYQKIPNQLTNKLIKKSLFFLRSIFINKFFLPNNLIFPKSRIILESYFN